MIGIKFKIPNKYSNYLKQILNEIDNNNYMWKIDEEEAYSDNGNNLFLEETYSNIEFKKIIEPSNYYTIFLNIQMYNDNLDNLEIKNYNDFIKSSCILIIFITDNEYVDIYSKDNQLLEKIKENAIVNNFQDIKIITNSNDIRKTFSAYTD